MQKDHGNHNSSAVISVQDVSKSFAIYQKPLDIVKEALFKNTVYELFWALRNISFEVLEQQRVGIIGQNGAGKSTLLQLICGNLKATSGNINVKGKISALMSLVPFWNTEETGLENIKFNLLLQGYSAESIPPLVEEIIDFTELGPFIFRPVKTYSTGMSARLSFAIATAIVPEILIIDEVLGVGDGYFVNKATKRIKELCDRGKALLFVSHSSAAVRSMCNKAIWMHNGNIRLMGDADYVVSQYEEDIIKAQETIRKGNVARLEKIKQHLDPNDIQNYDNVCQFRLREKNREKMLGTHYMRNIQFSTVDLHEKNEISLFHADVGHVDVKGSLDLYGSEWGRSYTKNSLTCRILSSRDGGKKGGHILIKRPDDFKNKSWPIIISCEVNAEDKNNILTMDFLNLELAAWQEMECVSIKPMKEGWFSVSFLASIPEAIDANNRSELLEKLVVLRRSPVKILDVSIISNGVEVRTVKELAPFTLRVRIHSHESSCSISVNLNISRADGVFVFYQPSGLEKNIENFIGDATIDFDFRNNPFGIGEYEVTIFVCNGFGWDNIPPSDIFDKSMGVFRFSITSIFPIPFGLINVRVPVNISLLSLKQEEHYV